MYVRNPAEENTFNSTQIGSFFGLYSSGRVKTVKQML